MPSKAYLTAVQQTTGPGGDPGCATPPNKYTFGTGPYNNGTTVTLALPYGSWLIYTGSSSGSTTTLVPAAKITITDSAIAFVNGGTGELLTGEVGGSAVTGAGAVTLDPRQPK
jgi:hypothetical protein